MKTTEANKLKRVCLQTSEKIGLFKLISAVSERADADLALSETALMLI
jgi:hypothetical protein